MHNTIIPTFLWILSVLLIKRPLEDKKVLVNYILELAKT